MTSVNVASYDGVEVLRNFVTNSATHRSNGAQRRVICVLVYFRNSIEVSIFVVSNSPQYVVLLVLKKRTWFQLLRNLTDHCLSSHITIQIVGQVYLLFHNRSSSPYVESLLCIM